MSIDTRDIKDIFDPTVQRMVGFTVPEFGSLLIDVPYISEIVPNLWQGGCPSPMDGPSIPRIILPPAIRHVVTLYPGPGQYRVKQPLDSQVVVRMNDSTSQSLEQVDVLAAWVNVCATMAPVLVHCQAGLNRSGLVVGRALMYRGMSADEAIELIRTQRSPSALCNPAFEGYLRSLD